MKTPLFTTVAACVLSFGLSGAALAAPSPTPAPGAAASAPYNGFLLGSKIEGSHLKNMQNEDIGTINDLIVNPDTGRVRFAVLDVGGFLGIDVTKVVVPWGAISLQKNKPGDAPTYEIDATKDRLGKGPEIRRLQVE